MKCKNIIFQEVFIFYNQLMQLTIISGENVASLEVASDMELENFLALCKLEFDTIANIAFDKLVLNFNGRQMVPKEELLKRTLQVYFISFYSFE